MELDASVMHGPDLQAGAIAAVRDIIHPVRLAREVLEHSPHVMLAGRGAEIYAAARGLERVGDPRAYYHCAALLTGGTAVQAKTGPLSHGTVGAVVLDRNGRLAAATSTGGTFDKQPGRVGDTPIIGAGTWADDVAAVSGTGQGEYFLRLGAARDVAARMHYQGLDVDRADQAVIDAIGALGGDGGLIAIDRQGRIAMPFNSGGMKRGYVGLTGDPRVEVY